MEVNIYANKFNRLIERIFEDNYELDRFSAEKLLKCLADVDDDTAKNLLSTPVFSDLIFHSVEKMQKLSTQNKIFLVEVITVLCYNELQFNRLQSYVTELCLLKKYIKMNLESQYPSMELHRAYVKLATAQLSHASGLKAALICKTWVYILFPNIHTKPPHVAQVCYEFISRLIWKLENFEEEEKLVELLDFVIQPLLTSAFQTLTVFNLENEKIISEPLMTPLKTLLYLMKDITRLVKSNYLIKALRTIILIKTPLYKILDGARDETVVGLVNEVQFRFCLAHTIKTGQSKPDSDTINNFLAFFNNQLSALIISKRLVYTHMEFVIKAIKIWAEEGCKLCSSTFERNGHKFEVEDQLTILAVTPLLTYSSTSYLHADKVIEKYSIEMTERFCEHIVKSCYNYRMMTHNKDLKKFAIKAIRELLKLKGLLKAPQAGLVFQSLFYVVEMYSPIDEEGRVVIDNPLKSLEDVTILTLVLDCMKMLLLEHNIHWYENLEIICIQYTLLNLLKQTVLPSKNLIQVLGLIELSIRMFLSPDMTLLVESKRGSTLDEIAAVLKSYIQHEEWEVRDSALTLLLSCIEVAFVKYVPLQKLISANGLMLLAYQAAISDSEYYVQVAALQCLAAAIRIEGIRRELLAATQMKIGKHLIFLLRNSPEGMLRREAVNVIVQIYVNHKTSPQFERAMYTVMASAALDDLHWEVQVASLAFWKHVIKKHLSDKGMIDGKFPKVTFSKEKRKIVVLDEREIKKQLTNILNELSEVGCLSVLHGCLKEEFNVEVMTIANGLATKLVKILDYYNFDKCPETANVKPEPMDEDIKERADEEMALDLTLDIDAEARKDRIINDILNTNIADLIMDLEERVIITDTDAPIHIPRKPKVHPNTFLEEYRRTDYANVMKNMNSWNVDKECFDYLLDELLER